jgi:hypothetical protein
MAMTIPPNEQSGRMTPILTAIRRAGRYVTILSCVSALLLLCPLNLHAQDNSETTPAPMGQLPQVAIGQQYGPDGQPVNSDSSSDYQPPDDSDSNQNATSDDDNNNSDDNADSDNNDNSDSGGSNSDDSQSGSDDNSTQPQQPDSN